jgi:hypothetical protein
VKLYGVWYDDGHIDCGWLNHEGGHGRPYRAEYSSLEDAHAAAEREAEHDKKTVFYAADVDTEHEKLFKIVRKLVNAKRLARAERELQRAKAAIKEDDEERRTAFERVLDDDE